MENKKRDKMKFEYLGQLERRAGGSLPQRLAPLRNKIDSVCVLDWRRQSDEEEEPKSLSLLSLRLCSSRFEFFLVEFFKEIATFAARAHIAYWYMLLPGLPEVWRLYEHYYQTRSKPSD